MSKGIGSRPFVVCSVTWPLCSIGKNRESTVTLHLIRTLVPLFTSTHDISMMSKSLASTPAGLESACLASSLWATSGACRTSVFNTIMLLSSVRSVGSGEEEGMAIGRVKLTNQVMA